MPAIPNLSDVDRLSRAVASVRTLLRDKRQLNRLLGGAEESTDEEIRQSIFEAIDDWNNAPPPISSITLATHPAKYLLVQCAAYRTLRSAMLWHAREQLPASDGGTMADDHAKFPEYSGIVDRLMSEYEQKRDAIKLQINITSALGTMGLPSEYSTWSSYGYDW